MKRKKETKTVDGVIWVRYSEDDMWVTEVHDEC